MKSFHLRCALTLAGFLAAGCGAGVSVATSDAAIEQSPDAASAPPRPTIAPLAGPVPQRTTPDRVEVLDEAGSVVREIDGWDLLDGDPGTSVRFPRGRFHIRLNFDRLRRVDAIGHAATRGVQISVTAADSERGASTPVPGIQQIPGDDPSLAWHRVNTSAPFDATTVDFEIDASGSGSSVGDLAVWTLAPAPSIRAGEALADQLVAGSATADFESAATPAEASISGPDLARSEDAGEFRVRIARDPRTFRKAFIVYELTGLPHWSSAVRQVNGLSSLGGFAPSTGATGGLQVEEIDPRILRRGDNHVRFSPADRTDAVGYRVKHLRVVAFNSDGVNAIADESIDQAERAELRALTDGRPETTVTSVRPRARSAGTTWTFGRPHTIQDVTFRLAEPLAGTLDLAVQASGAIARHEIPLEGLDAGWHRVAIDGVLPAADAVRVKFSASGERVGSISDLYLTSTPEATDRQPSLTLTFPLHGECVGESGHVRGFISNVPIEAAQLWSDGRMMDGAIGPDGAFGIQIPVRRAGAGREDARVELVTDSGIRVTKQVHFEPCSERRDERQRTAGALVEDTGAPYGAWVRPGQATRIEFGEATLEIPAGAVDRDVRVTVRPLVASQVPSIDRGMTNVTPGARGFRFGPHHLRFRKPVRLVLPYDHSRLPRARTVADVQAFYYDEGARRWRSVHRASSPRTGTLVSVTNHFTDYVTATLSVPDHPQASSFDENSISGLELADPTSGVSVIAPPQPNSSGTANLSHPIEVPPGRAGIQPSLAIAYNSEASNGWLGVGWDLSVPAIEIDTRAGAPRYSADGSEETYTLQGDPLIRVSTPSANPCVFRRRVEGAFDRILRHGTGPTNYTWEVIDRQGTHHLYGTSAPSRLASPAGGQVFRWRVAQPHHSSRWAEA